MLVLIPEILAGPGKLRTSPVRALYEPAMRAKFANAHLALARMAGGLLPRLYCDLCRGSLVS